MVTWGSRRFLKSDCLLLHVDPGGTFGSDNFAYHQTGVLGPMTIGYLEDAAVWGLDYSATFGSSHALSIWCGRVLGAEEVSEVLLLSLLVLHAPSFTLSKGVTVSAISLCLMTLPKLLSQCCTRRLLRLEVIVLVWKADVVECFRRRWFYTVYRVHYLFHSVVFTLHFRLIKLLKMSLLFLVHFSFP